MSSLVYQLPYFSAPRPRLFGRTCKPCELAAFLSIACCCAATKCQITQRKSCSGVLVERHSPFSADGALVQNLVLDFLAAAKGCMAVQPIPWHARNGSGPSIKTICVLVFVGSQRKTKHPVINIISTLNIGIDGVGYKRERERESFYSRGKPSTCG